MSSRIPIEQSAPFQTINETARLTGLSRDYIRRNAKAGVIPAIKVGNGSNATYMIDTVLFLEQLHCEAEKGVRQ